MHVRRERERVQHRLQPHGVEDLEREEVQAQCQLTHSRFKKKHTHKNNTLLMLMSLQFVEADVFQVDASPVNFCRGDGFMGFVWRYESTV